MLISNENNFLFIHVYKVAGMSISSALIPYAYSPYGSLVAKLLGGINLRVYEGDFHRHITALQVKNKLEPEKYNRLFKFAFVRNPWDWQVSLYKYMLQRKHHHQRNFIKVMGSFEDYVEWRVTQNKHLQKDFICDAKGDLIVDFVGKFENLESDFNIVCDHLKIEAKLPHANKTKNRTHYSRYYTEKSRNMIEENFKEDIELFGYSFEHN